MDEDLSQRVETLEKQVVQRFLIEARTTPKFVAKFDFT